MKMDIPSITGIVAAIGVIVGVIYYILDIRYQTQIRETELEIRMNPVFNLTAIELQQARLEGSARKFQDKYGNV